MGDVTSTAGLRRLAGRALVGGLCIAAAVAIVALLTGSFDDTDWKVIGTSLGFGVFSSTAAAGGSLRLRGESWAGRLGAAAVLASVAAFALLFAALWISDGEGVWRAWGVAGLAALWTAHASLILRPLRPSDRSSVRSWSATAVTALGIDTAAVILLLVGIDPGDSEILPRLLGVVLVVAILATALVPILRRMTPHAPAPVTGEAPTLAQQIAAAAARLDPLAGTSELRAEVARLRDLAREAERAGR